VEMGKESQNPQPWGEKKLQTKGKKRRKKRKCETSAVRSTFPKLYSIHSVLYMRWWMEDELPTFHACVHKSFPSVYAQHFVHLTHMHVDDVLRRCRTKQLTCSLSWSYPYCISRKTNPNPASSDESSSCVPLVQNASPKRIPSSIHPRKIPHRRYPDR
jgi:hypothetical protein